MTYLYLAANALLSFLMLGHAMEKLSSSEAFFEGNPKGHQLIPPTRYE